SRVLPGLAATRRPGPADLPVTEDLGRRLQHGRGSLFTGDPAARRRTAAALAHLCDGHQSAHLAEGAERDLRPGARSGVHREPSQIRSSQLPVGLLHGSVRQHCPGQIAAAEYRVLRSQPGQRQRLRGSPPGLLPQRAHLLRPGAAGSGGGIVSRGAGSQGISGHRLEGVAALQRPRRSVPGALARPADLSEEGRDMRIERTLRERVDGIVVGASAGGVEALALLLPALPARMAASVFVVVHVPRERPSLLVDIFASRCPVTVREATDKEPVRPATVYFAPPDYHLLVEDE